MLFDVILSIKTSSTQVRVKVGNEEWSINRRYAEFREFHSQVSEEGGYMNFILSVCWGRGLARKGSP